LTVAPKTRIPGVNVSLGVARLGGNQDTYFRLLKRFYHTYYGFSDRLQTLFHTEQFDEILNQIHALKGVSGNLGAEELHQALSDFTQGLKHPEHFSHLSGCHDRVQQALTTLLRDLAESPLLATKNQSMISIGKTSSTAEEVPLELLLKRFSVLLEQDLGAAIAVFEQLKQLKICPELTPIIVAMETELDNFNLDSVHQHLHVLTASLDSLELCHPNGYCLSG
jgi:HPt (histidine-containing phosphotransfer) domain-containing protein